MQKQFNDDLVFNYFVRGALVLLAASVVDAPHQVGLRHPIAVSRRQSLTRLLAQSTGGYSGQKNFAEHVLRAFDLEESQYACCEHHRQKRLAQTPNKGGHQAFSVIFPLFSL